MNRNDFSGMTIADQGMVLLNEGKHLTVLKKGRAVTKFILN